ncbi:hypothetical protein DL96DRAFT_1559955 [Flagelloscypha sp. PMI_526]|nr:hypothetical protein DL96DRAFT_1559955 [Flagelloscypha sp. PMI_526]
MASSPPQIVDPIILSKSEKEKREDDILTSDSDSVEDLPSFAAATAQGASLIYEVFSLQKIPSTLNATYSLRSGQVIYKTETPRDWLAPDHTLIQRIKSDSGPIDEFETIAIIHHKAIGASTFQFGEEKILSSALITKESAFTKSHWSFYGRDRLLTLPDGTRARWLLGIRACALISDDENKTPLAIYHRRHILSDRAKKSHPNCFEIFPAALSVGESAEYQDGILTDDQRKTTSSRPPQGGTSHHYRPLSAMSYIEEHIFMTSDISDQTSLNSKRPVANWFRKEGLRPVSLPQMEFTEIAWWADRDDCPTSGTLRSSIPKKRILGYTSGDSIVGIV